MNQPNSGNEGERRGRGLEDLFRRRPWLVAAALLVLALAVYLRGLEPLWERQEEVTAETAGLRRAERDTHRLLERQRGELARRRTVLEQRWRRAGLGGPEGPAAPGGLETRLRELAGQNGLLAGAFKEGETRREGAFNLRLFEFEAGGTLDQILAFLEALPAGMPQVYPDRYDLTPGDQTGRVRMRLTLGLPEPAAEGRS